uniref:Non-structural protein NS-S n=1 Tax=Trivittatus virus TaxID=35516 RepID=A0A077ET23_9VIRU|nr:nonstructural protein [Trivittatus virus]
MMLHQQVQTDLIPMQGMWHLLLHMPDRTIFLLLGSSSSMLPRPRMLSREDQRGRLVLNLASGRWRWSIIIFLATGTIQLVTTILPSTEFQAISQDGF